MAKIEINKTDLKDQFDYQKRMMTELCNLFDNGNEEVAKDIAVKLRVLFSSSSNPKSNSKSLLRQLSLEHLIFVSTCLSNMPGYMPQAHRLVALEISSATGAKYIACLNNAPDINDVPFFVWWSEEVVFNDKQFPLFTREKLVKTVADTDGGAHVDAKLDEKYHSLSRENLLGYHQKFNGESYSPMGNPVYATIRQIAEEVNMTFKKIDLNLF